MRLMFLVVVIACVALGGEEAKVRCVKAPPKDRKNPFYVSNRPPLAPSPFMKLPIGSIKPGGWLRRQLELEAEGFTGRLTEISRWCRAEGNAWLSPEGKGHSPWEELPYWLKGFGDLGYVLGNQRIIKEARKWIEGMLASQQPDGWFGPVANKSGSRRARGKPDLWPNMIALNCLQSYYEFTGDERVIELMRKYFKWELGVPDKDFLPPFWQNQRAGDNLASVYWLYNRTGEKWLLDLAAKIHRNMARWDKGIASWHGVNIAQCFREPTIFWMQAKTPDLFQGAYRNYKTVRDIYGQMPGGMYGADENCRKGYTDPRQAAETCAIVEMMHSCQMLTKITGDPLWADRCEDAALNSFPASMTPDLKGLHYLTAPNMAVLDARNHSPGIQNGGCMLAYNPRSYRCCQHNTSHGWPYYAEELWLATPDRGLCASLYAASTVQAKVGDGAQVTITETTDYPFGETVALEIDAPKAVRFPLYLRVPRWCAEPKLTLNGDPLAAKAQPLAYLVVERTWRDGDKLTLTLPMKLSVTVWKENKNAVSVNYGPLTFSLEIGERWERRGRPDDPWCLWEVFPTTPWNYGLELDPANPEASLEIVRKKGPFAPQPFTPDAAPIEIRAKARRIPEWSLDRFGLVAPLQESPAYTSEPLETVTLVPMGCARLRISAFPTVSTSPDANHWKGQPKPPYEVSASHCNPGDTTNALWDGLLPRNSNDHSIPRMTWWPRRGTTEWVAYAFGKPRTVSSSEVYWFDDTGRGLCRVPASWRLLYREGKRWTEVKLAPGNNYGVEKDKFNKVAFEPVTTTALRLEVKLQPTFSGGILEWRIGPKPSKK